MRVWLERYGDRKCFLFLHAYDTHAPFVAHPHLDAFESEYDGPLSAIGDPAAFEKSTLRARFVTGPEDPLHVNRFLHEVINQGRVQLSARDREHVVALYDNEIRFVDDAFCRLLAWIDELGLSERTILLLTSDHDEELFERGRVQHGGLPYDDQIHVPLILRGPRLGPAREACLAQGIDVAPTLLSVVGIPPPPVFRGRSLLTAGRSSSECVVSQSSDFDAARSRDRKLILAGRTVALYDLETDPDETTNVAAENPDDVARLRGCLTAALGTPAGDAERIEPEGSHVERLQALGYLD